MNTGSKNNIFILNSIPNYTLSHFYCREEGNHGGSCILVASNLDDLCTFNEDRICLASFIEMISLNIIVISVYIISDATTFKAFLYKLESLLKHVLKINHIANIYIASDLNVDLMENSSHP